MKGSLGDAVEIGLLHVDEAELQGSPLLVDASGGHVKEKDMLCLQG